jgi:LmbE family N-acetylglucosaminyl deacetylase
MLAGQIVNCLEQFQPEIVLTHGSNGEYGPPAHVLLHQLTRAALATLEKERGHAPAFYTFAANYSTHPYPRLTNAADPADVIVDVRPVLDYKEAAARCHQTQTALFVRRPFATSRPPFGPARRAVARRGLSSPLAHHRRKSLANVD